MTENNDPNEKIINEQASQENQQQLEQTEREVIDQICENQGNPTVNNAYIDEQKCRHILGSNVILKNENKS